MKTGHLLSLLAVTAVTAVSGCRTEERILPQECSPVLFARAAEEDTRAYIDGARHFLWNRNDSISAFLKNTYNAHYVFDGEDGDNEGTFSLKGSAGSGAALSYNFCLYPYMPSASVSSSGNISFSYPAEQKYAAGTVERHSFVMGACSADHNFTFKSLCAFVTIQMTGTDRITKLVLQGRNGEILSGAASVSLSPTSAPTVSMNAGGGTEAALISPNGGVQLNETEPVSFWISIPPTEFTKGCLLTIYDDKGYYCVKTITSSFSVRRAHIKDFSTFRYTPDAMVSGFVEKNSFGIYSSDGDTEYYPYTGNGQQLLYSFRNDSCSFGVLSPSDGTFWHISGIPAKSSVGNSVKVGFSENGIEGVALKNDKFKIVKMEVSEEDTLFWLSNGEYGIIYGREIR